MFAEHDVSAIVFDYYGTLADYSFEARERLFDDLARRAGANLPAGEAYRHWREEIISDSDVRLGGLERPPLDGPTPAFVSFRETWLERFQHLFRLWGADAPAYLGADAYAEGHATARAYPDVLPSISALQGRYRLAVLSDADDDFLNESIRRNQLPFDIVISSEQLRAHKPYRPLFRHVCDRLGVEPQQAVYLGDSPWADIEGARQAGMQAVWMNRVDAPWPDDLDPPQMVLTSLQGLLTS